MQASSFQIRLLLTSVSAITIALGASTAWAGNLPTSDPEPLQLPDPPDPNEHTAQDDGDPVPDTEEDHTAQDDGEPTSDPPFASGKEKWKDGKNREWHQGKTGDGFDIDINTDFDAPLIDVLDIPSSGPPDARLLNDGSEPMQPIVLNNDRLMHDHLGTPQYTNGAIPTPGVLVIIGAGALALRRRRRQ